MQARRLRDDGAVGAIAALDRGEDPEPSRFFTDDALDEDRPLGRDTELHGGANGDAASGEPAFHVARAAAVKHVLMDAGVEGVGVPPLALAGRNDVDVSVQDQRRCFSRLSPACDEVLSLDGKPVVAIGAVRRERWLDRPKIDVETPIPKARCEGLLRGVFVAGDTRRANEVEGELVELVPKRSEALPDVRRGHSVYATAWLPLRPGYCT